MSDQYLRLLRSLVKTVETLKAFLNKHAEAVGEHQEATNNRNQRPSPVEITSELCFPVPIREYYEAEQRERQSTWRKIKEGLGIVGVGAAVILAILTYFTLQKVRSQADSAQKEVAIMRQQLEASSRPWIMVDISPGGPLMFTSSGAQLSFDIMLS